MNSDELPALNAALCAKVQSLTADNAVLNAMPKNWELTWGEIDDPSECAWHVHSVNGGRNDREWTLIATGETPLEAVRTALEQTGEKP